VRCYRVGQSRRSTRIAPAGFVPISEKPLELQPHLAMPPRIDATERYLLRVFLRRLHHMVCAPPALRSDAGRGAVVRGVLTFTARPPFTRPFLRAPQN